MNTPGRSSLSTNCPRRRQAKSTVRPCVVKALTLSWREGGPLNWPPSAVADAGNGRRRPPPTQSRKRGQRHKEGRSMSEAIRREFVGITDQALEALRQRIGQRIERLPEP